MQLKKVYFDAFRSLVGAELDIAETCIGLVGINESGKSNILKGIAALSPDNPLTIADTPKMEKKNPQVRFEFQLNEEEVKDVSQLVGASLGTEALRKAVLPKGFTVMYHVIFDRDNLEEIRFFTIPRVALPTGTMVLRADALTESWRFRKGDIDIPLNEAILVSEKELASNKKLVESSAHLAEIVEQIESAESGIAELTSAIQGTQKASPDSQPTSSEDTSKEPEESKQSKMSELESQMVASREELQKLSQQREMLEKEIAGFDIQEEISDSESELSEVETTISDLNAAIEASESKIAELQGLAAPTPQQKQDLATLKKSLDTQRKKLKKAVDSHEELTLSLDSLRQPLVEKFSQDPEELARQLGHAVKDQVATKLPKVVLWQHKDGFILKGETEFQKVKDANSLDDISRPLVNLFRIGLNIKSMDDLRTLVAEIQGDAGERSRYEATLNTRINDYIRSVWEDYDQRIKIKLEKERIIVQFYDPLCDSASYFEMQERSQGAQTFISFLLTIGAEAKQGIIRETVLLLDEPETHLHPSGVRFMLQELIKAARNGNVVVYATHSIFMIDREHYSRHAIVTKRKERSKIKPSSRNRVGFFMQEEVLYGALNINLNKDFDTTNRFNFVFEGDGDAILFRQFYESLNKPEQPYSLGATSFYQGGKCSDIKKYFAEHPIQLGSVWIFVLDSDGPAQGLRNFLEDKYKDFIDSFIFIFQYKREGWNEKEVQFEDLLPEGILREAITLGVSSIDAQNSDALLGMIDQTSPFSEYFAKISEAVISEDKSGFKGKTKAALNEIIGKLAAQKTKKADLEKEFPAYFQWAQSVVSSLKESRSKEKKQKG